jgi:dihydrofolate reductase
MGLFDMISGALVDVPGTNFAATYQRHLAAVGSDDADDARSRLAEWLDDGEDAVITRDDVRIILVSAGFDTQITATVLWRLRVRRRQRTLGRGARRGVDFAQGRSCRGDRPQNAARSTEGCRSMRSITVTMWITLDGVVQGLGRPDEDTRDGFVHGGWGRRYDDEVMGREMAKGMAEPGDMLFGRRTWEDFITAWGRLTDGNPVTTHLNAATKYVVSRTLEDADAWQNSILLYGDAVDTVAELKAQSGLDLSIIGSASLVRSLHAAALIDRYTLVICPLTLGSGTRLFDGPAPPAEFDLTESITTTKGVIIAHYTRR